MTLTPKAHQILSNLTKSSKLSLPSRLYHLTREASWPSIQRYGLLSTQALLDLVNVDSEVRELVGHRHRPDSVALTNEIIIGDQKPMPPSALARSLHGITPEQWYALLNTKVFFWPGTERLIRLSRVYRSMPRILLTVDTQRLLERYAEKITLTPINTGNARRQPAQRSPATFVPYNTWLASGWLSETEALHTRPRSRSHPAAELTVDYAVPDILNFVVETRRLDIGEFVDF